MRGPRGRSRGRGPRRVRPLAASLGAPFEHQLDHARHRVGVDAREADQDADLHLFGQPAGVPRAEQLLRRPRAPRPDGGLIREQAERDAGEPARPDAERVVDEHFEQRRRAPGRAGRRGGLEARRCARGGPSPRTADSRTYSGTLRGTRAAQRGQVRRDVLAPGRDLAQRDVGGGLRGDPVLVPRVERRGQHVEDLRAHPVADARGRFADRGPRRVADVEHRTRLGAQRPGAVVLEALAPRLVPVQPVHDADPGRGGAARPARAAGRVERRRRQGRRGRGRLRLRDGAGGCGRVGSARGGRRIRPPGPRAPGTA